MVAMVIIVIIMVIDGYQWLCMVINEFLNSSIITVMVAMNGYQCSLIITMTD